MDKMPEEQNLINALTKESSLPDSDFKELLKAKTVKEYQNSTFLNIFGMKRNHFALLTFGVIFTLLISIVGGLLIFTNSRVRETALALSDQEKSEILQNVLKNNSGTSLRSGRGETADAALAPSTLLARRPDDYSYRYTKTTTTVGPAAGKCEDYSYFKESTTSESYEYFNADLFYSKYVLQNNANQLIDFSLSVQTEDQNEYYVYKGGKYAIKYLSPLFAYSGVEDDLLGVPLPAPSETINDVGQDLPISSDERSVSTDDTISQYFGEDVQIDKIIREGNKEYYLLKYTYSTSCSGYEILPLAYETTTSVGKPTKTEGSQPYKIITVNWVDTQSYEIAKTELYFQSEAQANLIYSTATTVEGKNIDFTAVAENFAFPYDVEVREIDERNSTIDTSEANLNSYLKANRFFLLFPNGYTLTHLYAKDAVVRPANSDYYTDRDFYPSGPRGDELFEEATKVYGGTYVEPLINSGFTQENLRYLNVNIYDNTESVDAILTSNGTSSADLVGEEKLILDNEQVTAKKYTYNYGTITAVDAPTVSITNPTLPASYPTPEDARDLRCPDCDTTYESYVYLLEYRGFRYLFTVSGTKILPAAFTLYDTSKTAEMSIVTQSIRSYYQNQGRGETGASSAGSSGSVDAIEPNEVQ